MDEWNDGWMMFDHGHCVIATNVVQEVNSHGEPHLRVATNHQNWVPACLKYICQLLQQTNTLIAITNLQVTELP